MARAAGGVVEWRSRADEIMRESPWQLAWRGVRDELFNNNRKAAQRLVGVWGGSVPIYSDISIQAVGHRLPALTITTQEPIGASSPFIVLISHHNLALLVSVTERQPCTCL